MDWRDVDGVLLEKEQSWNWDLSLSQSPDSESNCELKVELEVVEVMRDFEPPEFNEHLYNLKHGMEPIFPLTMLRTMRIPKPIIHEHSLIALVETFLDNPTYWFPAVLLIRKLEEKPNGAPRIKESLEETEAWARRRLRFIEQKRRNESELENGYRLEEREDSEDEKREDVMMRRRQFSSWWSDRNNNNNGQGNGNGTDKKKIKKKKKKRKKKNKKREERTVDTYSNGLCFTAY